MRAQPVAAGSDASAHSCDMSGWQSQWPLPSPRTTTHSARRRQGLGRGERDEVHGGGPEDPPPQEPGTQHFFLDDESVPELGGGRPDPVQDPGPLVVEVRHDGVGFEILLDVRVPQVDRGQVEEFREAVIKAFEKEEMMRIHSKLLARIPLSSEERKAYDEFVDRALRDVERVQAEHALEVAAAGSQSSNNKMGRKRKKRKRRKKLPKRSSSSFLYGLRDGVGHQGIMYEYAEDENEEFAGYSDRWGTAPCMKELGKFIEKKVIKGEEFIHKHGQPEWSLFSDRLHMYIEPYGKRWLHWMKNRHRYIRWLGHAPKWTGLLLTASDGPVCDEARVEQTLSAMTVKDLIWLLCYVPPVLEFQPGRADAVYGHIHRMIKLGNLNIDDDDEGLGDDLAHGLKRRAAGWRP